MSKSFSHSALETYNQCGEKYRLWYLSDTPRPESRTVETIVGTCVHSILEIHYSNWMNGHKMPIDSAVDRFWFETLQKAELEGVYASLRDYHKRLLTLRNRASKNYAGSDAIRTKDGSVSKSPHLTSAWTDALKSAGLEALREGIDWAAGESDSQWTVASLCDTYSDVLTMLETYKDPYDIHKVEAVEFKIEYKYPLSGEPMVGYIDIVARSPRGHLIIIDHKTTSKPHRESYKVEHHDQLLLYGWAYSKLTGETPGYLGINFIKNNSMVVGAFDMNLAERAIERREKRIAAINAGLFAMQSPTEFGSPCWREYSRTACPYLDQCHPEFADHVKSEFRA